MADIQAQPAIAVITVTYNSEATLEGTLRRLRRAAADGVAETVLVDNASTDRTRDLLDAARDWATVVFSDENIGFGRGCNLGAAQTRAGFLLFLNPDAEMEPRDIAALADLLDRKRTAAIVGPATDRGGGQWQHAGGLASPMRILRPCLPRGGLSASRRIIRPGEAPFQTDWVSGGAMMVRREAWEALGGFDPRFFLYFEETDLCRRALDAGWEIWASGEAICRHDAGHSARQTDRPLFSNCIPEHYFRSRFYYLRKHWGPAGAVATELAELALLALRSVVGLARGGSPLPLRERLSGPLMRTPRRLGRAA